MEMLYAAPQSRLIFTITAGILPLLFEVEHSEYFSEAAAPTKGLFLLSPRLTTYPPYRNDGQGANYHQLLSKSLMPNTV